MTFKIKLKRGFFKTELYDLSISSDLLILTPTDYPSPSLEITKEELKSIAFIARENSEGEIEIITNDVIYNGNLLNGEDNAFLGQVLYKEFGNKFTLL